VADRLDRRRSGGAGAGGVGDAATGAGTPPSTSAARTRLLAVVAAHLRRIDRERERRIRVAHLVHGDARVLAERVEERRERPPERMRRETVRERYEVARSTSRAFASATVSAKTRCRTFSTLIRRPVEVANTKLSGSASAERIRAS
jgi:hypothetical protein